MSNRWKKLELVGVVRQSSIDELSVVGDGTMREIVDGESIPLFDFVQRHFEEGSVSDIFEQQRRAIGVWMRQLPWHMHNLGD